MSPLSKLRKPPALRTKPLRLVTRISGRFAISVFAAAALAIGLATPATGANLIVDSGFDQNGNPGSSSPYNLSSGSASYDGGYVCVSHSGVVNHSGGTLTLSTILYL